MLAVGMSLFSAWKLYQRPDRANVQRLYGWMLLVLAYEYAKHLGEELARPVAFLFTADWAWLVPAGSFLVAVVPDATDCSCPRSCCCSMDVLVVTAQQCGQLSRYRARRSHTDA